MYRRLLYRRAWRVLSRPKLPRPAAPVATTAADGATSSGSHADGGGARQTTGAAESGGGAGSDSPAGAAEESGGAKTPKGRSGRPKDVQISMALSQVCRHKAADLSLQVRPDGYLVLSEVLGCKMLEKFKATPEQVERIVRDNDKQRFSLAEIDGKRYIRANQGHSMKGVSDEQLLDRLRPGGANLPSQVVHGTYQRHWSSILEKGLLAGGKQGAKFRNHVHFATGLPADDGVISGMRGTCDLAIYLDLGIALEAGLPLYRSSNEVIVSPGFEGVVPVSLFSRVVRLKDGSQVWPEA